MNGTGAYESSDLSVPPADITVSDDTRERFVPWNDQPHWKRNRVETAERCAACGARGLPLRLPMHQPPDRPNMRVCVDDKPCYDRWVTL